MIGNIVIHTSKKNERLCWQYYMRRSAVAFLCLFFAAFSSYTVHADNFDTGVAAYKRGDFDEAARRWKTAAESGNVLAQFNLALLYEQGQGVDRHWGIAAHWYRTSADAGYDPASFSLGSLYYRGGPNFPKNVDEAVYWWVKAAERGDLHSQTKLAAVLISGEGVPRDILTAKRWLTQAAQKHHQEAIELLAQVNAEIATVIAFDDQWVRMQNPTSYTIEYYRGDSKNNAREFIIYSQLENASIYQSQYGDFTVVSGVFPSPEGAFAEINKLSESVKQYKPRPRIFSTIQAELQPIRKTLTQPTPALTASASSNATQRSTTIEPSQPTQINRSSNDEPAVYGQDWILNQNSKYYTVQLVRSPTSKRALKFISDHAVAGAAIHLVQNRDNIVTMGVFATRAVAQEAIRRLPNGLKQYGPFPQQFADIHDVLGAPRFASSNKVLEGTTDGAGMAHTETAVVPSPTAGDDGIPAEEWILAQNSKYYTMRMIRVSTYQLAVQFVKRYKLKMPAIYRTAANNYDVIDGVYSGAGVVRREIGKLPASLKRHKPFPRQFTKVKVALNPPTKPANPRSTPVASNELSGSNSDAQTAQATASGDWTLNRRPNEFTVLLFSSDSAESAKQFLTQYQILNGIVYKMGEKFGVISGVFQSENAALEVTSGLPENILLFRPSPISFERLYEHASTQSITPELVRATFSPGVLVSFDQFWGPESPTQRPYTLLLYSSTSEAGAQNFVEQFQIAGATTYKRKNNTFGVIEGRFIDEQEARGALNKLPEKVKLFSPQPIFYQDIISELAPEVITQGIETLGVNWILERNPSDYTVVLFEGRSEAEALRFVTNYSLGNAAIYREIDGKANVISGVFVEEQQAQDAINGLPDAFSGLSTSIVSFADVQGKTTEFITLSNAAIVTSQKDSVWIRNQKRTNYTIEIHSAKTPRELSAFVKKYGQIDGMSYQTKKEIYKTIVGVFDSRKSAKRWLMTISSDQKQEYRPRLRKFSRVIKELSDFDQKIEFN